MEKDLNYYFNLPYTRELVRGLDGIWFVRIKELPGCFSQGSTQEEALRMIDDALLGWLSVELEDGEEIPEPRSEEEFSGKFNTRVPKSLHRKLVEAADRDGVSLNQWINTALAEAIGSVYASVSMVTSKHSVPDSFLMWKGLITGVHSLLLDVSLELKDDLVEETLFSEWITQNFQEILSDCECQSFDQALSKANFLSNLLSKYSGSSPLLNGFYQLSISYAKLIKQVCALGDDVEHERQINQEIGKILSSPRKAFKGQDSDGQESKRLTEQFKEYESGN